MSEKVLVTPAELSELATTGPVVIIDTRDPATYAAGHLPGAVNVHDIFTYLATSTPEGVAAMREKFAAIFGTSGTSCHASNAPAKPANTLTSKLSKTKRRIMLLREAPIAIRKAISRRRALKRTSRRLATLLHAISNTNATAASKVANAGRKFPVTSSGSVLSVITDELSILSGCCAR